MDKKEIIKEVCETIYEIKRRLQLYRFLYSRSQEKTDSYNEYFTNWINYDLQNCLQTQMLVDLRILFDDNRKTISLKRLFTNVQLIDALEEYRKLNVFINNYVTHKNQKKAKYDTFTIKSINDTIEAIQKVIDDSDMNVENDWYTDGFMAYELTQLDEKIKRFNDWERGNNLI